MEHRDILDYIAIHYEEFPNFDDRSIADVFACLPDQDARYAEGEDGLIDLLNDIEYR